MCVSREGHPARSTSTRYNLGRTAVRSKGKVKETRERIYRVQVIRAGDGEDERDGKVMKKSCRMVDERKEKRGKREKELLQGLGARPHWAHGT